MSDREQQKWTELELEAALESPAQKTLRDAVRALPEDSVSLAWRSELNERLREAQRPRRAPWFEVWRPALGLAVATSLALVVTFQLIDKPEPSRTGSGLEAVLVAAHNEAARIQDVAGVGLGAPEVDQITRETPMEIWDEVDTGSL